MPKRNVYCNIIKKSDALGLDMSDFVWASGVSIAGIF